DWCASSSAELCAGLQNPQNVLLERDLGRIEKARPAAAVGVAFNPHLQRNPDPDLVGKIQRERRPRSTARSGSRATRRDRDRRPWRPEPSHLRADADARLDLERAVERGVSVNRGTLA